MVNKTLLATVGTALMLWAAGDAAAQAFPSKPIRMVNPFAAGGALDVMARAVAKSMSDTLQQQVFVDNRPGANGVVGTAQVARSAPDGYTILIQGTIFLLAPTMMGNVTTYDPIRELAPISNIAHVPQILLVPPTSEANSLAELIALARAKPTQLNYGSGGTGSSAHMATELLTRLTGTKMTHVPYRGDGPALSDLLGGQLQLKFENVPTALPHMKAEKLKALGVTTAQRLPLLPDLPAVGEMVPGYEASIFQALFAPANTPKEIMDKLHGAVAAFANDPATRESYVQQGVVLQASASPESFAKQIAQDHEKWTAIVKEAGIKVE